MASGLVDRFGGLIAKISKALAVALARRLLRHSICVWAVAVKSEGEADKEFSFNLQNLEQVPIERKVIVELEEMGLRSPPEPLFKSVNDIDPPARPDADARGLEGRLRVYSGRTIPTFTLSRVRQGAASGTRVSFIEFTSMPGYDTWSIRLRSPASAVTMRIRTEVSTIDGQREPETGIDFSSLELDLAVRSVTLNEESRVITAGPSVLPTWPAGIAISTIGPALYATGLLLLFRRFNSDIGTWWPVDLAIVMLLEAIGIRWYLWTRRPVIAAIQAYRLFWIPGHEHPYTDETVPPLTVES